MSHWRLSDWTLAFLSVLTMLAAWEGFMVGNCPANHGCGGCFSQFYVAGTIIHRGEAERLYDQPYFRDLQQSMRDDPLRSLYPPTMGLLMAPLARLSYHQAMAVWYAIQVICILVTGVIFYRTSPLSRPWRINMLVALTGLVPLWIAVGVGQLSPMFLLLLAGGLALHKRRKCGWAGLLFSLLALKPQLAAGLVLWMLLRRDIRTLLGLAAGFAIQAMAVATLLGPGLWVDYLHAMPTISAVTRYYHYSPLVEASFVGMASNLFWAAGLAAWESMAMKITYAATASAATLMLCHVVWARRSWQPTHAAPGTENLEYACGVLFMMVLPPYFLLYDQTLMAVPLVMLWSSPAWRWGVALFATATALLANLPLALGFSLTGFVALATMLSLAVDLSKIRRTFQLTDPIVFRKGK
jgi:hypothetical protein